MATAAVDNTPIAPQLNAVFEHFSQVAPQNAIDAIKENLELLSKFDNDKVLQPGQKLPSFKLPNAKGSETSSAELAGSPFVVTFYRGTWCPFCNIALSGFQKNLSKFQARGVQIVAISPQLPDGTLSTVQKNELEFHVLSDVDNAYARELGLVWQMTDAMRPVMKQFGNDLEKVNGNDKQELPVTATFLVGKDGTVLERFIVADYTKRVEPGEVLEWLDKHNL